MGLTMQDMDALIELALRAPRTQAETLWLAELLRRVETMRQEQADAAQQKAATG